MPRTSTTEIRTTNQGHTTGAIQQLHTAKSLLEGWYKNNKSKITGGWESEEFKADKASKAKTRAEPKPMPRGKAAVEKPAAKAKPSAKAKPLAKPKATAGVKTKFDKKVTQQAINPTSASSSELVPAPALVR